MKKLLLMSIVLIACVACLSSCMLIDWLFPCKHKETVTDAAVAATCTETGLTEGSHCAKCGETVVKQEIIAALGHTEVIDEAVAPTCTEDGLSAGVHCYVCDSVVIAQNVVPASHTYSDWVTLSEPDCFFEGEQTRACAVCEAVDTQKIDNIEHSFVQNEETKLFSCELCDARIYAGHLYVAIKKQTHWFEAYEICDSIGGHLATITSQQEQSIVADIVYDANNLDANYWLGGIKNTNGFEWITEEEFSYAKWDYNQPEGGTIEWFVGIKGSGMWHDYDYTHIGSIGLYMICEWELDIEESEHYFTEWETTTKATCYGDGEQYRICTHCGLEETEVLPQLEHNFLFNEATGITGCEHCNAALYNGHIYKIFTVSLSWFDAYAYCDDLGGHLVTITSAEEQTFIETYMNSQSFSAEAWIGSYSNSQKWQWVTDETFEYTNWDTNQPNNYGGYQFCGSINWNTYGEWHDRSPLEGTYHFLCEWESE